MRYEDKNEHPFAMDRYGNRIMAQTKCRGGNTRTLHNAFQADVAVPLGLCGIPFRAASKGNMQTKGMLGIFLGPIERARDAARRPLERSPQRKGSFTESSPTL